MRLHFILSCLRRGESEARSPLAAVERHPRRAIFSLVGIMANYVEKKHAIHLRGCLVTGRSSLQFAHKSSMSCTRVSVFAVVGRQQLVVLVSRGNAATFSRHVPAIKAVSPRFARVPRSSLRCYSGRNTWQVHLAGKGTSHVACCSLNFMILLDDWALVNLIQGQDCQPSQTPV